MIIELLNSAPKGVLLALFVFLSTLPAFSQQVIAPDLAEKGPHDKEAKELLLLLEKQIGQIRSNQFDYIAEEEQRQEEFDEKGKVKRQRQLLSNFYRINLGAGVEILSEWREVISVDGKPVGDGKKIQELLLSKGKSIREQMNKISEESKKYNLGASRPTNQPFVGLRFADHDRQQHSVYYTDQADSNWRDAIKLYFHENDETTMFQHNMPFSKWVMPSEGHYLFALDDKQFLGYDISIHNKDGTIVVRLVARYSRMKDGKLLPASFEEYTYDKNGQIKTHSISEYGNYRHFTVDTKINFESIE